MHTDLRNEISAQRDQLRKLSSCRDEQFLKTYLPKRPPIPPGFYWKLRWFAGWVLRGIESLGLKRRADWPVSLKNSPSDARAKPVLIWALGVDRGTLRAACEAFSKICGSRPDFAPVLVTDIADFAYYSRLGWLVEFVPRLKGAGEPYDERKIRFLARLYDGAAVWPARIWLSKDLPMDELLRCLNSQP